MHWIVLALSLGTMIVSLIHGVLGIWQLVSIGNSVFTWTTGILLLASAFIALIGGILAFNRRKTGGIFLIAAALTCIFIHPSTRVYGWVHLAAGLLAFLIRSFPKYDEFEGEEFEDGDEYEAEEEYEEEKNTFSTRTISGKGEDSQVFSFDNKRKERASRINLDREEYSLSGEGISMISEPLRVRSSKVCPACGASVGIDHKFCYTCGNPLYGTRMVNADSAGLTDVSAYQDIPSAFIDFQTTSSTGAEPAQDDSLWRVDGEEGGDDEGETGTKAGKYDGSYEESPEDEAPEEIMSPRIFVKPSREDETELKSPFMVDPDDSYQEFSNYTRRRKRKRSTLTRRILGPLVLLLAVSGAAWLLLGMRKVPEPVPPVVIEEPPVVIEPVVVVPEPAAWDQIQIEAPARGVVTGNGVNIRQSNAATGAVVTKLNSGARVDVIEQRDGTAPHPGPWFNIRVDGRTGWIYGQFFQLLDGRQATLPRGYTATLLSSFGSDRPGLTSQLGQPTRQTPAAMTWTGLTAELRGDNVARLQLTGAQHVLQNELAVGITEEALYRRVGYPSDFRAGQLRYVEISDGGAEQGIIVRLQNGRVQSITVGNI